MSPRSEKPEGLEALSELVIVCLGPSGAGKSTFINALLGEAQAGVSHGFESGTMTLKDYSLPESDLRAIHPNLSKHGLILLDTPGFQNAYLDDSRMLIQLSDWLASATKKGRILVGIVYLFPIFPVKMTLHERQNLELLPQLFESRFLRNSRIFPATSRWDMCSAAVGARREAELCQKFWNQLLSDGTQPHRFANNVTSARYIVKSIVSQYLMATDPGSYSKPLVIQQEQVDGQTRPHFIARLLTKQRRPLEAKKRCLVLLMGETGAGKSTFVNDLAGENLASVNHGIRSATNIEHYDIPSEDGSSVTTFVDCPGYNHTSLTDNEISAIIRDFLAKSPLLFAPDSAKVIGVICFIDPSQAFRRLAAWHPILTNERLKCPKLLAVTDCSNVAKLQASMAIVRNQAVIQDMEAKGTLIKPYPRNSARTLVQSMRLAGDTTPHVTLRMFLNHILPR